MKYAGIGSRETPLEILRLMTDIGTFMADRGFMLRSGGARGADSAFEAGVNRSSKPNLKVIYTAQDAQNFESWSAHAATFHPAWDRCSDFAKLLHARNSAIILGATLNDPVLNVICWTKDGKDSGGTGQALRIARAHCINVWNLYDPGHLQVWQAWLK